jgi:hypothetical protein
VREDNPVWSRGLRVLAGRAKREMDRGLRDDGLRGWVEEPAESYAELFAFLSLVGPEADRAEYAARARTLLLRVMRDPPGDPEFATSDRSRWTGEAFPLAVDWIRPHLSEAEMALVRTVFHRWSREISTHGYHRPGSDAHPRWAANNYFAAHARNLGMMAIVLGERLDAASPWIAMADVLLRTDARGGAAPEGFEYGPQTMGYYAQLVLAMRTAGVHLPLEDNPFWDEIVPAWVHSLSPRGDDPAWYGDGQVYAPPDPIEAFGPLAITRPRWRDAIRWIETHAAGEPLLERVSSPSAFSRAILMFLVFDPDAPAAADPRPSMPLTLFAPGTGRLLARTGWGPDASWFTWSLGWQSIDHQHGDGNSFELYRNGEWLTKERTGYDLATSDFHNTVTIENDRPEHDDYRADMWRRGSQWTGLADGDPSILERTDGPGYVAITGDATPLYNSSYEGSTDVAHASRSIVWLQPGTVVVYDRATTKTGGRDKRFVLQLPSQATIDGRTATAVTRGGQRLAVTTVLPAGATIHSERSGGDAADGEPMTHRLVVSSRGRDVRFLHVLGEPGDGAPSLVRDGGYEGVRAGGRVVLFRVDPDGGGPVIRVQ